MPDSEVQIKDVGGTDKLSVLYDYGAGWKIWTIEQTRRRWRVIKSDSDSACIQREQFPTRDAALLYVLEQCGVYENREDSE